MIEKGRAIGFVSSIFAKTLMIGEISGLVSTAGVSKRSFEWIERSVDQSCQMLQERKLVPPF